MKIMAYFALICYYGQLFLASIVMSNFSSVLMHKKLFLALSVSAAMLLTACKNDAPAQTSQPAAPVLTINEQSSEVQKVGYAAGYDMGRNLKKIADDMDLDAFQAGVKDAYAGTDAKLSEEQMQSIVQTYMTRKQEEAHKKLEEKAVENKAAGEAWLAQNATKEGVKTTKSGLQYKVIREGTGTPPKATDTVVVNYEGKLIDGKVFDSSYERGEPIAFPLNQVIPGWTEGLQLMKPGAEYELYVPADLAYGETGAPDIEPNSTLIFKVELLTPEDAKAAQEKAHAKQQEEIKKMMESVQEAAKPTDKAAPPTDATKTK